MLKSILVASATVLGVTAVTVTGHARGDVCAGLFKTNKFVVFLDHRGKAVYIEGQAGAVVMARYDVQPRANRSLKTWWTGGVQGEAKYENNFTAPAKLPGWGHMQQKYQGYPDRVLDVFFAAPEQAVKKDRPTDDLDSFSEHYF
ncbi:MAG: hypothetical protein RBT63_03230 [Bdellovibrionales bacterium]|jgi:hypothetical protein|nr:hypothetical protein [Bdellovibrionales bacterium]